MPSPGHQSYRGSVLKWFRGHGKEPDVAQTLEQHKDAAQVLWHLDLDPALPTLKECYAPSPRGGAPWDPLVILRALLLSILVGTPRINSWVPQLKASRVLRILCGLPPKGDCPGVGTFYDFLHRLHDGPIRRDSEQQSRPSVAQRRRANSPKAKSERPKKPRAKKGERSKRRRHKNDPVTANVVEPAVTEKLVAELQATRNNPNPNNLLCRLCELLLKVAVLVSADKGLLGNLQQLVVSGDSSALPTWANGNGKRICGHPRTEHCDCPRLYSDPDAAWGYDSYRECYFFGYKYYELIVSVLGHDLPLFIALSPANESDFTAMPRTLEFLLKSWLQNNLPFVITAMPLDCGHDGEPVYRYLIDRKITPIIPLKTDAPAHHPQRPELALSPRGVPLCKADTEMAPWGSAGADRKVFVCPVKAGTIEHCPLAPKSDPSWVCRPELKWGPTVSVCVSSNPRLCPPIPRNSPQFIELYKLRSASERTNSVKKELFQLEAAHHCRESFWLIRLYLMAVLQHARAWCAKEKASDLVDHLLGRKALAQASGF